MAEVALQLGVQADARQWVKHVEQKQEHRAQICSQPTPDQPTAYMRQVLANIVLDNMHLYLAHFA